MHKISVFAAKRMLTWVLVGVLTGCSALKPAMHGVELAPSPAAEVSAATTMKPRTPRIGLALGGGAARGFAHVGVLAVLEQHGIKPDVVVGTSAGSLVAVLYASGKNAAELESLSASIEEGALADWTLPFVNRGVLKGEALAKYVNQQLGGRLLEQLPIAVGVVATDLATGQGVLFRKGSAGTAVRASSSVPGVFQPVNIAGHEYVDGGLVAPVPVRYAQQMGADVVIAVDISSTPDGNHTDSSLKVMLQTFAIMGQSINQHELGYAQIVVKPALAGVGGAAFSQRQQSIAAGKEAMLKALPKLTYELARWSSQK